MQKSKGWKIKSDRPEEIHVKPEFFYTKQEIESYSNSNSIKKTQEAIASRIIELLNIKEGKILDLGAGPGFTSLVYQNAGFEVLALDKIPDMLAKAKEKKLKVIEGDMLNLSSLFKPNSFDAVVSASALQWIKDKDEIREVALGVYLILKPKGKIAIQFYPKSEEELLSTAHIFKKCGFEGQIILDNPDNPKKRLIFLVMQRN